MYNVRIYLERATEIPICMQVGKAGGTVIVIIWDVLIKILVSMSGLSDWSQGTRSIRVPKTAIRAKIAINLKESMVY